MTGSPKHMFQQHLDKRNKAAMTTTPMEVVYGKYETGGWMTHGKAYGMFFKESSITNQWSVMVLKYKDEEDNLLPNFIITGESRAFQSRQDARAYVKILRGSA